MPTIAVADELVELTDELKIDVAMSVVSERPLLEVGCDGSGMDGVVTVFTDVLEPFCEFVDGDSIVVVLDGSDCVLDTPDDTKDGEKDEDDVEDREGGECGVDIEEGPEGELDEDGDAPCDVTRVD